MLIANKACLSLYIVLHKLQSTRSAHSREIEQMNWFHYDGLPERISPGTKRRLKEYFTHSLQSEKW